MRRLRRFLWLGFLILLVTGGVWRWRAGRVPAPGEQRPSNAVARPAPVVNRPLPLATSPMHLVSAVAEDAADAEYGVFEGQVLSADEQRAVPKATLTFLHAGAVLSVVASEQGAFRLVPSAPGRFELSAVTAEGFRPFMPELGHSPVVLLARAGARVRDIELFLERRESHLGVVLDPAGHPVADAVVQVLDAAEETAAAPLRSDASGEFRCSARVGSLVEARHPGFAAGFGLVSRGFGPSPRFEVRLGAPRPSALPDEVIAGWVTDQAGQGIDGAVVVARSPLPVGEPLAAGLRARATTEADGSFTLRGLAPGTYQVLASAPGLAPAGSDGVRTGTRNLTLRLDRGGALCGEVREAQSRRPVPGFSVVLWPVKGPVERGESLTRSVFDARGAYEVSGLLPGDYLATVVARRFAPAAEVPVHIPAGARCVAANFTLSAGGKIFGKVVNRKSSAPLAGAHVELEGRLGTDSSPVPLSASATTDALGEFTLSGLAPGLRSIHVGADGYHSRILAGLAMSADGNIGPVTVELNPTAPGEAPQIEYVGIGAVLVGSGDGLLVSRVFPGGGAAEVGLSEGDSILAIDEVAVTQLGFESAIQRIRGPEGTTVGVRVRRHDGSTVAELTVPRRPLRS